MSEENMAKGTEAILDHLPKKTPSWAIGLSTVIVLSLSAFIIAYTTARPELQKFMESSVEEAAYQRTENAKAIDVILTLVKDGSKQVTILSQSVYESQRQILLLTERVSSLEKNLEVSASQLLVCEKSLKECQSKYGR